MTGYNYADGNAYDQMGLIFSNGTIGARFDFQGRERQGTTASPTVAVGAGAGTGATVTSHSGTDADGTITITTGTSPAAGTLATVTFAVPYTGTNPPVVNIQPKDAGAAALYYANCTNSVLTIKTVNAPSASTAVAFDYEITGGA